LNLWSEPWRKAALRHAHQPMQDGAHKSGDCKQQKDFESLGAQLFKAIKRSRLLDPIGQDGSNFTGWIKLFKPAIRGCYLFLAPAD
jgi:hypothetical protein